MVKPFNFKQFTIEQDRCAMKIGTDGVLLGAWAGVSQQPFAILDIGAGTGIISLMLAQRCSAQVIDAIEIDGEAYEQCTDNFENSPWGDRLFCYHAGLDEFVDEIEDQYDLIVSNPPFYAEDYKTKNLQRDLARFQDALPFQHLIEGASKLLAENGVFALIVPYGEEKGFIDTANGFKFYPKRITRVKGNPTSEAKRSLIEFTRQEQKPLVNELIIENDRHDYTEEYINLTKEFYLKM